MKQFSRHLPPFLFLMLVTGLSTLFLPVADAVWIKTMGMEFTVNTGITAETSPTPCAKGTSIEAEIQAESFWIDEAGGSEEDIYGVTGQVCVLNKGERDTQALSMRVFVEFKPHKGQFTPLQGAEITITPVEQLTPGQMQCYAYSIPFALVETNQYRAVAAVTITNHSGWLPGGPHCGGPQPCPFGPEVKACFNFEDAVSPNPLIEAIPLPSDTPTPTDTPTETEVPVIEETPSPTSTPTETPTASSMVEEPPLEDSPQPEESETPVP